ncbi:unnamed protein product [Owenia fusiformis]|uniref:H/ACA ribonucleoprotein complex non-core subunit NAF1 n=1 Tax=Owenia fusiformis TaxID=6347 RepID=A0A8J1U442_OWEFU|nr:unnamed protein product [Owenia fusiformis]
MSNNIDEEGKEVKATIDKGNSIDNETINKMESVKKDAHCDINMEDKPREMETVEHQENKNMNETNEMEANKSDIPTVMDTDSQSKNNIDICQHTSSDNTPVVVSEPTVETGDSDVIIQTDEATENSAPTFTDMHVKVEVIDKDYEKHNDNAPGFDSEVTYRIESSSSSSDSSDSEDSSLAKHSFEDLQASDEEIIKGDKNQANRKPGQGENRFKTHGELLPEEMVANIEEMHLTLPDDVEILPVGKVSSVVELQVVIQGLSEIPALDLDSVLFLKDRSVCGQVFDVIGPVIAPFYTVLFSSEQKIKELGIEKDTEIYYAPGSQELTKYVFLAQLKQLKGSDASWEFNNEPPQKYIEYSDDEAERKAKHKAKQKNRKPPQEGATGEEGEQQKKKWAKNRNSQKQDKQNSNQTRDRQQQQCRSGQSDSQNHNRGPSDRPITSWPPERHRSGAPPQQTTWPPPRGYLPRGQMRTPNSGMLNNGPIRPGQFAPINRASGQNHGDGLLNTPTSPVVFGQPFGMVPGQGLVQAPGYFPPQQVIQTPPPQWPGYFQHNPGFIVPGEHQLFGNQSVQNVPPPGEEQRVFGDQTRWQQMTGGPPQMQPQHPMVPTPPPTIVDSRYMQNPQ